MTLSHLDQLEETSSFWVLKRQVAALLPRLDLPKVLLEIQARTGLMNDFTHTNIDIMRTLQRASKPSTLAKAIGELGRVSKTLYLLNYVDDENHRRRILTQLNRGEGRHPLARAVFHGRKGEVR